MEQAEKINGYQHSGGAKWALTLAMLLASLGTSIANIALPTLAEAFAAPFGAVQAVVVAYLAALTVFTVAAGRLGDRFGLRRVLNAGLTLFALSSLLCAVAPTLWFLIGARLLQGAGAAVLMTLAMALMRSVASAQNVGRAMGLLGMVSAMGMALGPALGGFLIPLAGWRSVFFIQIPLAFVALLLSAAFLPAARPNVEKRTQQGLFSMLDWRMVPNLATNFAVAAVMMATLVVGPFLLGMALGLKSTSVGLAMSVGPVISITTGVPAGKLVDRAGSGRMLMAGLALLCAGAFLLALLPGVFGLAGFVAAILVLTPGYQLFQAANNTQVLADIAPAQRGTMSGLLSLSRNAGLISGATFMGVLFAYGVGASEIASADPLAIFQGSRVTFLLCGGLMAVCVLLELATGRRRATI